MLPCGRLHAKSVAYAATSLGAHLINPVFSFYYVKIYLNRFHVTEDWFQMAQIIFMIWNAINDPLFGCLQDNVRWLAAFRSRRHSILYGAPLFVVSFLCLWFPWTDYDADPAPPSWVAGVQLTFALCFYDAVFTFVLLAQCALFAELSVEQTDRVRLVRYQHVAGLLGSVSVLVCEATSDGLRSFSRFQWTCVGLGLAAGVCFVYTGLKAHTPFDRQQQQQAAATASCDVEKTQLPAPDCSSQYSSSTSVQSIVRQTKQIFAQPSFISFVLTNLCQIYHMTFIDNFANIVGDRLLGGNGMSGSAKSLLYGSMFLIPQMLVIGGAPLASSFGYYRLVKFSFILNIAMGLLFMFVGYEHVWFVAAFLLIESASTHATFSLFGLCLSDVIDVDMQQHRRSHPLSSMVFGLNALVTKPSISLAPMVTVAILNRYGYQQQQRTTLAPAAIARLSTLAAASGLSSSPVPDGLHGDELTTAMFYTACLVPIVSGLVQLVLWRFYTIRESHKPGYQLVFTTN